MLTCYFFVTPIIDYSKLIEEQSNVQSVDIATHYTNLKRK